MKTEVNLGAILVEEKIKLNIAWMHVHRWLYERGEEIISDARYNSSYECYAISEGVVGCPAIEPSIPDYASLSEEADWSGKPMWDHMGEFRRRKTTLERKNT